MPVKENCDLANMMRAPSLLEREKMGKNKAFGPGEDKVHIEKILERIKTLMWFFTRKRV